jgi:malate synthase
MKSAETKALDEEIAFVEKEYSEAVERIKEKALEEAEKDKRELEKRIKNLEKSRDEIAEQSKRRIEELEAKLGRMPKPFKVVKPFVWGVRWEPGQTLKTVDWEWAFKMVESGYLEPIPEAVAPPPAPPKAKELTEIAEEAIRELETLL